MVTGSTGSQATGGRGSLGPAQGGARRGRRAFRLVVGGRDGGRLTRRVDGGRVLTGHG
jgi:hypothetical protein